MKKTYMKPEVNEIEVSANQAVAACANNFGSYSYELVGYGTQWDGCRNAAKLYNSKEEAEAANRGPVAACYDVYRPDGSRLLSWEDYNCNGVWEVGSIDNWQNVESYNEASGLFNS